MLDTNLLLLFIPTCFIISITPGMCMTLAMSLGMSIGIKRTFYMMWGELLGVAIVAISAVLGVATIMLNYPELFNILKWGGAIYLASVGVQLWRSKGKLALNAKGGSSNTSAKLLFSKGFITAIANPKGWAFTASLLPPFINTQFSLTPQLSALVIILLASELICMCLYAGGGSSLKRLIKNKAHVTKINKVSGSLMICVGLWLALA